MNLRDAPFRIGRLVWVRAATSPLLLIVLIVGLMFI